MDRLMEAQTQTASAVLEPPASALEARERAVLSELARDSDALVAFQGLRRRLELHPQSLTRVLRRLRRRGYVLRDARGYRLTELGFSALQGAPAASTSAHVLPVLQVLLPARVGPAAVARRLAHRWFRGLRWYGESHGPGETTLTWLTEADRARVRVRVAEGRILLEIEASSQAHDRAFTEARGVLAAIAELYGLGPDSSAAAPASATEFVGFAA